MSSYFNSYKTISLIMNTKNNKDSYQRRCWKKD